MDRACTLGRDDCHYLTAWPRVPTRQKENKPARYEHWGGDTAEKNQETVRLTVFEPSQAISRCYLSGS